MGFVSILKLNGGTCARVEPSQEIWMVNVWMIPQGKRRSGQERTHKSKGSSNLVACHRRDTRIIKSRKPYGSTAIGGSEWKRTILLWFIRIQENTNFLDTFESENPAELTVCHNQQIAPKLCPSGLHNKYGRIDGRISVSTYIEIENPVNNKLICYEFWNNLRSRESILCAIFNELLGFMPKNRKQILATKKYEINREAYIREELAEYSSLL